MCRACAPGDLSHLHPTPVTRFTRDDFAHRDGLRAVPRSRTLHHGDGCSGSRSSLQSSPAKRGLGWLCSASLSSNETRLKSHHRVLMRTRSHGMVVPERAPLSITHIDPDALTALPGPWTHREGILFIPALQPARRPPVRQCWARARIDRGHAWKPSERPR